MIIASWSGKQLLAEVEGRERMLTDCGLVHVFHVFDSSCDAFTTGELVAVVEESEVGIAFGTRCSKMSYDSWSYSQGNVHLHRLSLALNLSILE